MTLIGLIFLLPVLSVVFNSIAEKQPGKKEICSMISIMSSSMTLFFSIVILFYLGENEGRLELIRLIQLGEYHISLALNVGRFEKMFLVFLGIFSVLVTIGAKVGNDESSGKFNNLLFAGSFFILIMLFSPNLFVFLIGMTGIDFILDHNHGLADKQRFRTEKYFLFRRVSSFCILIAIVILMKSYGSVDFSILTTFKSSDTSLYDRLVTAFLLMAVLFRSIISFDEVIILVESLHSKMLYLVLSLYFVFPLIILSSKIIFSINLDSFVLYVFSLILLILSLVKLIKVFAYNKINIIMSISYWSYVTLLVTTFLISGNISCLVILMGAIVAYGAIYIVISVADKLVNKNNQIRYEDHNVMFWFLVVTFLALVGFPPFNGFFNISNILSALNLDNMSAGFLFLVFVIHFIGYSIIYLTYIFRVFDFQQIQRKVQAKGRQNGVTVFLGAFICISILITVISWTGVNDNTATDSIILNYILPVLKNVKSSQEYVFKNVLFFYLLLIAAIGATIFLNVFKFDFKFIDKIWKLRNKIYLTLFCKINVKKATRTKDGYVFEKVVRVIDFFVEVLRQIELLVFDVMRLFMLLFTNNRISKFQTAILCLSCFLLVVIYLTWFSLNNFSQVLW